jgi:hypothetical protein
MTLFGLFMMSMKPNAKSLAKNAFPYWKIMLQIMDQWMMQQLIP